MVPGSRCGCSRKIPGAIKKAGLEVDGIELVAYYTAENSGQGIAQKQRDRLRSSR
jgi:hypothetical protein